MNKNVAKIKAGIRALGQKPYEILSGTVVPGSMNADNYSISVLLTGDSVPIRGVMLNPVTANGNGMVLFPKDGSNVIIGSMDGPGEWVLLKASDLSKAIITIENVKYEIDDTHLSIKNGSVVLDVGAEVLKMNTASESLFHLLKDLITAITVLTVGTSTGPSTVPINVATFDSLLTRLNNLLSA